MKQFNIDVTGNQVVATNAYSGQAKYFSIVKNQCEINGDRLYLVEKDSSYRVRLHGVDDENLQDACMRFAEGALQMTLYKQPKA